MRRVSMLSTYPPMRCGIGDHVREFLPHLTSVGAEVELVTFEDAHRGGGAPDLPKVHLRPSLRSSTPPWAVARELRAAARDSDALLWQSQNFIYPRAFNLAAPLLPRDLPLVTVAHDVPTLRKLLHVAVFLRRLYSRSDVVVSHSPLTTEALTALHGVPRERVVELPLGVDTTTFHPRLRDPAVKHEMGWKEDDIVVLYLGFINEGKGVRELIQAFARVAPKHPRLRLTVGGHDVPPGATRESSGGLVAALQEQAKRSGVADRIRFSGFVPRERFSAWLASADVLALPYRFFFQCAVLAKAMGSGGAILATDIPGFAQWLRDGETAVLVRPGDPDALAAGLDRLAADESLRAKLRRSVGEEVARRHSMDVIAQRMMGIIDQAQLARGRSRRRETRS